MEARTFGLTGCFPTPLGGVHHEISTGLLDCVVAAGGDGWSASTLQAQTKYSYADLVAADDRFAATGGLAGRRRDLPPVVELGSQQPVRCPVGEVCPVGCQRRRSRVHPPRGRPDRDGRNGGARLHLANLVGSGSGRARQDLSRRPGDAGCRPAVQELLQRRHGPVSLSALVLRPEPAGLQRTESVFSDSLSEILQGRGGSGLGPLLPLRLHQLSAGNAQCRRFVRSWRRSRPSRCSA